ncbi:saccharopine dehydrogenase NADP-binding domain-containing protein [Saccharothrix sp. AJ9571]|nr:saccharopine dehydrogenase NADP-binding domain-containing protein [Saccharothrix sp. AJ9571]
MKIAVYGASGFTGKLVVAELARRGITGVAAGRDAERLRAVAERWPGARWVAAEVTDPAALVAAFRGCDVVISAVSPFIRHGEPVVRAAIQAGCHYVDTSGEQLFVKRVFDVHHEDAVRAGVTVVPAVTDDGLPGDLIAHLVGERAAPAGLLTIADLRGLSEVSRGTATMALENKGVLTEQALSYHDGEWRTDLPLTRSTVPVPDSPTGRSVVKFAVPGTVTVPRHVSAQRIEGAVTAEVAAAFTTVTPAMVESLPEGPGDDARRASRWMMAAHATGHDGREATGAVWGNDPYGSTAVVAVEMAQRLTTDGAAPGVLAPAQAVDPSTFLDALAVHGIRWSIQDEGARR